MGLITEQERYDASIAIWTETTDKVQQAIEDQIEQYGSIHMMTASGAKGNIAQIRQMAGMRGLMSDPSGRIIDLPIRSSFRELFLLVGRVEVIHSDREPRTGCVMESESLDLVDDYRG